MSVQRPVGSGGVVVDQEIVELVLQLGDGVGRWLGAEVFFEGLVEALDFAAGLWVVGPRGQVLDAECA